MRMFFVIFVGERFLSQSVLIEIFEGVVYSHDKMDLSKKLQDFAM